MEIQVGTQTILVNEVNPDRNYWLVRTYGGSLYEDFVDKGYVGLGLNNVPFEYINKAASGQPIDLDKLTSFIDNNTRYKGSEAKKWAKQLVSFSNEVKVGDVVVIPNEGSKEYSIGTISSGIKVRSDGRSFTYKEVREQVPEKIRTVNWDRVDVSRSEFQTDLRKLLSTHRGISNIGDLGVYIQGQMSPVFVKKNQTYLLLSIGQDEDINAFEFNRFISNLTYFYTEFCKDAGYEPNEELYLKIKVQSRGMALFSGAVAAGVVGLALLLSLPKDAGITAKVEMDKTISIETNSGEGLLESISKFLDKQEERRQRKIEFDLSIQQLKAKVGTESLQSQKDSTNQTEEEREKKDSK